MATNEIPQEYYIFFIIIGLFELVLKGIALCKQLREEKKAGTSQSLFLIQ